MDIMIISEFCEDFSKHDNDRFLYLANILAKDNDVEFITSSFQHSIKKHRLKPKMKCSFRLVFVDEPGYKKNVCLKRFYSHLIWGINVVGYVKKRKRKPDVIYCAVPSLSGSNMIAKYCEKEGIRFIIDIQDLWPEAYRMVFNVPIISNIIFAPFRIIADGIYKRADSICAVSNTYCQRAASVNNKCTETTTVFLGTDLRIFDKNVKNAVVYKKKAEEIWLAYCGTLGSSYDLKCVIDALYEIGNQRIKLVVMGDGPKRGEFEQYAKEKNINSVFTGRLPYNNMCGLLSSCDIAINPIAHLAAGSIINKHADYAAAGIPVLSTQESDEYRNLVEYYKMGYNCMNGNPRSLSNKINKLVNNKDLRKQMGNNARRCAEEKFDRNKTYYKLVKLILDGD